MQENPETIDREYRAEREPSRARESHLHFDARGCDEATAAATWSAEGAI
jgi:hypothetical protein